MRIILLYAINATKVSIFTALSPYCLQFLLEIGFVNIALQKIKSFIINEKHFIMNIKRRLMHFFTIPTLDLAVILFVVLKNVSAFPTHNLEKHPPIMSSLPSKPPKGKGYLRCYIPSDDYDKRLNQKISLASAMDQQGILYSSELVYRSSCSPKMNNVQMDEQRHLLSVLYRTL